MDLVVFENNKPYVIDEFREGRFDYVELASDVAETKFFQYLFGQQIVNKLKKDKIDAKIDEIAKSSKVSVPEDFDMNVKAAEPAQLPTGHPAVPSDKQ